MELEVNARACGWRQEMDGEVVRGKKVDFEQNKAATLDGQVAAEWWTSR